MSTVVGRESFVAGISAAIRCPTGDKWQPRSLLGDLRSAFDDCWDCYRLLPTRCGYPFCDGVVSPCLH